MAPRRRSRKGAGFRQRQGYQSGQADVPVGQQGRGDVGQFEQGVLRSEAEG